MSITFVLPTITLKQVRRLMWRHRYPHRARRNEIRREQREKAQRYMALMNLGLR